MASDREETHMIEELLEKYEKLEGRVRDVRGYL
jgi:hypothetical protein